ncbi:adenylosuccinate synthetase [Sphingosinicella sp. BN140058]|uniref:adenylosuccinate synthetase n=1 Tax=Sphingosinicella sp. BN140058 TaxID=1892855 RepID=UPI001980276F|nr:adenylosuccinate synthetase [Sphingosinicella sp. BN140058]
MRAVIGANYGDEGKGRTVDWLAAPLAGAPGPEAVVVRSNGGAQAGHTVAIEGRRHVFHHFGSGTLRGVRTHLSRFMVSHPILFAEERSALAGLGAAPLVTADPRGWVTTPWDMMVNQALEQARGGGRHGSCGLGLGETVGRCEETPFGLAVGDLGGDGLASALQAVRDEWLPRRCAALGLDPGAGPLAQARAEPVLARFFAECRAFADAVTPCADGGVAALGAPIFEAAQGLLLDQNALGFPHVTRANTGLANMVAIAQDAGIDRLDAFYVSRCYLTRHGRGPMEDERAIDAFYAVDDPTNRPNTWQETLRFGLLSPARLGARIAADVAAAAERLTVRPSIALTCLDQARDGRFAWLDEEGEVRTGPAAALVAAVETASGLAVTAQFRGAAN